MNSPAYLPGFRLALAAATVLTAAPLLAQEQRAAPSAEAAAVTPSLEQQFIDPPQSARPRVWWHWMNGNITKDGIAKDMAWMKRVGIGGLQNFDANLQTPQIVDKRLVYMTPEWQDAFRLTAAEAERQGLELTIAASPGWSETGGPWVPPQDGLKKLVWSETLVTGGMPFRGKLAAPPAVTGPFQTLPTNGGIEAMISGKKPELGPSHYSDVAVLAVPVSAAATALPKITLADGTPLDATALSGANLANEITIPRSAVGAPQAVLLDYGKPQTIRAAALFVPGARIMFVGTLVAPVLEASDNGTDWRKVADIAVSEVPTTESFAPVTARWFRMVFNSRAPQPANMGAPEPGIVPPGMFAAVGSVAGAPLRLAQLRLSADPSVDQFETKAGFALTQDYFSIAEPGDGAVGANPTQVIDLTSKLRPDGSLDWTPPRGNWRVLRFGYSLLGTTNHPAPPEATGLEVDKFDGAAVRRYLEHYIGMYRSAAGEGMLGAKGVRAILTDSIEVGAANWTPLMIAQFKARRGYDPTPWLPTLAGVLIGTREQSDRFLYDYRRTLADLMASEHYGTVATVAHEHGLKVYGEALEDKRPSLGDDMAMRSHTDVPMAAMWTFAREQGPNPSYLADIKGAASVAHIYGQNLVAAESMTSALAYWAHSPKELRRIIDLEFVTGVNRPVIHTSVHQPRDDKFPGLSLFIFGQYFNRHESWAEMARPWMDYMARSALLLQQGRNVADVAYFYGEEAPLTGLYGEHPVTDAPKTSAYDFVNADALATVLSNVGDELVATGGARYKALYLGGSSQRMTLGMLRRITELVDGGATVVGLPPKSNPGLAGDPGEYAALVATLWPTGGTAQVGKGRVIASTDIEATLRQIGVAPDFHFTGGSADTEVPFQHRRLADGDSYFLVNRRNRPETIEARFRITGKQPEMWDAETGTVSPVSFRIENGETVVPLTLGAEKSVFIMFRKPAVAPAMTIAQSRLAPAVALDGSWTVRFEPARGAPSSAMLPKLTPLNENVDPGIKYYSGIATYARAFVAPKGWKAGEAAWLDLGEVAELAEVSVNGKLVGTAWQAPYRLNIGPALKRGRNRIEVRVANLWINRLIGDAQPGAAKLTFTAMPTYRADAPLRPSGLIGPVTIATQAD